MPQTSGLTVRQHERRTVEYAVEFVVEAEHTRQVRFSAASGAATPTTLRGTAVDLSPGGMGLVFRQFLPRMVEGTVKVFGRRRVDTLGDGTPVFDVVFEHKVKVRRVMMRSHDPEYELGVSFVEPGPDLEERVNSLLRAIGSDTPNVGGPEGRGGEDA